MIVVSRVLIPMSSSQSTPNHTAAGRRRQEPPDFDVLQQRLPIWQPLINFGGVWKLIFGFGVIMLMLGVCLCVFAPDHPEIRLMYEGPNSEGCGNCDQCRQQLEALPVNQQVATDCVCHVKFRIREEGQWKTPVYVYYELTDFYQNHRRYIGDHDKIQLMGRLLNRKKGILTPTCRPPLFQKDAETGKFYFPCGSIANSMFTDGFDLQHDQHGVIPFNKGKVSWPGFQRMKFRNPFGINRDNYHAAQRFKDNFVKPMNWTDRTWKEFWDNGGLENQHFMVWMNPAPFSTFRKLYGVIESGCGSKSSVLCAGEYTLRITYRYYMKGYHGQRSVILQTTSFLGTPKPFLKRFLIAIGLLCILFGGVFFYLDHALAKDLWPFQKVETILSPVPELTSASRNVSISSISDYDSDSSDSFSAQ